MKVPQYWKRVGREISSRFKLKLKTVKYKESIYGEERRIEYNFRIKDYNKKQIKQIEIIQAWNRDGTSTKPVTKLYVEYIHGDDFDTLLGRFAIWDNPVEYAKDLCRSIRGL